ncbi:MAG: TIGR03960 family B12-binding radical SAM protein, partial [Clostridia bacterium]
FSFQYELSYSNMLYMLDLAHIPFYSKDRKEKDPFIIFGGPCTVNAAPVMPFADIIHIGEGEVTLPSLMKLYSEIKGKSRYEILKAIDKLDGFICPILYEGKQLKRVVKQKVQDLNKSYFPNSALVPNLEIIHDRAVVELYRGCANGCRFCQAGFIYRPVRERSADTVYGICKELIKNTGYDELSLNSLSTSDYSGLKDLIVKLKGDEAFKKVNLALPSLRLNTFEGEFADNNRKTSLTFAPEAGTQRLRDVINKNITEDDIFSSLSQAFKQGYSTVKLYFMIGLPTETMADIDGIVDLAYRVRELFFKTRTNKKDLRLNVSASIFIPKPFTPFQWEAFDSLDNIMAKQTVLRDKLKTKNISFAWHDYKSSVLEALFARGGSDLAQVIEMAYRNGALMDGWAEYFNYDAYMNALAYYNMDAWALTKEIDTNAQLPWDFVDIGVKKEFLLAERKKAYAQSTTPSCINKCSACGISCIVTANKANPLSNDEKLQSVIDDKIKETQNANN